MIRLIETDRLILRELEFSDTDDLFEMDSDPEVHLYIDNTPDETIEDTRNTIEFFKNQVNEGGFPILAIVNKQTNECLGWSGLKYSEDLVNNHKNFYELGYRLKKKHWGNGYATESSKAIIEAAFENLKIDSIFAMANPKNINSKNVLLKIGFHFKEIFEYEGHLESWFELSRQRWTKKHYRQHSIVASGGGRK
jgi:[ribosomal protein S5]-alanine N-acetyltransferase